MVHFENTKQVENYANQFIYATPMKIVKLMLVEIYDLANYNYIHLWRREFLMMQPNTKCLCTLKIDVQKQFITCAMNARK